MSTPGNVFAERREELSAQIAQQRGDLVAAYLRLEKPIHYAEYGLRGFGFFRKNSWVFVAVPAVFSIASTSATRTNGKARTRTAAKSFRSSSE